MASQRSLTAGYIYADAPRNYATDTNFIVGLTTNALVVGNTLNQIGELATTDKGAAIVLSSTVSVITRLNYTIGGENYSIDLNISGTDAGVPRVVEEVRAALLDKNKQNALPRVMQFPENCLSVVDAGGGQINVTIAWKEGETTFNPVSIEVTGVGLSLFS